MFGSITSGSSATVEAVAPIGAGFIIFAWGILALGVAVSSFIQWRKAAKHPRR